MIGWHSRVAPLMCMLAGGVAGCASLLPASTELVERPWRSFSDARAAFDQVRLYETTTADLRKAGVDPFTTPNVAILNYSDIVRRLLPSSVQEQGLESGIRDCVAAQSKCQAYEIAQLHVEHKRTGGFWADFLNFKRETTTTGWRFTAFLVIVDERVIYKLWSGQPEISEVNSTSNPLGPLQGAGEASLRRF